MDMGAGQRSSKDHLTPGVRLQQLRREQAQGMEALDDQERAFVTRGDAV